MPVIGADAVVSADTLTLVSGAEALVVIDAAARADGRFLTLKWGALGTIYGTDFAQVAESVFDQDDYTSGEGLSAALTTNLGVPNADLTWTASDVGTAGNSLQIAYVDPASNSQPLTAAYVDPTLTFSLATDGGGAITSTASDLLGAGVDGAPLFGGLAVGSDGSGVVIALTPTNLVRGAPAVASSAAATATVFGALGLRVDDSTKDLWVIDTDGATVSLVNIAFDWYGGFALSPTADTAYVSDVAGASGRLRPVDTGTGSFGSTIETRSGFWIGLGGIRCLADGRILAVWQSLNVAQGDPVVTVLARYASNGTWEADVTVGNFTQTANNVAWPCPLMVNETGTSVWALLQSEWYGDPAVSIGAQEFLISDLSLIQETAVQLLCTSGFIAPVQYTQVPP